MRKQRELPKTTMYVAPLFVLCCCGRDECKDVPTEKRTTQRHMTTTLPAGTLTTPSTTTSIRYMRGTHSSYQEYWSNITTKSKKSTAR